MRVSKGSKIEIKINFNIPANDILGKIKIVDTLAPGLSYVIDGAVVFIDNEVIGEPDIVDKSTSQNEVLLELNTNIAQGEEIKEVQVVIVAIVTDLEVLLAAVEAGVPNPDNLDENITLENIAIVTALDLNDEILSEEHIRSELKFEKYNAYGSGAGYNVRKRGGENTYLMVNTTGVNSLENSNLGYKFVVQPHPELDFSEVRKENIFLTVKGKSTSFSNIENASFKFGKQGLYIDINHTSEMKGEVFYISIPVVTKSTIADIEENYILSEGTINLIYTIGRPELISTSPIFNIRTNLEQEY